MTTAAAAALTDFFLSAVSFYLAMDLATRTEKKNWAAVFTFMGVGSLFGGMFHGFESLHLPNIWTIVSGCTLATGFTFLGSSLNVWKPESKFYFNLWPLFALLGMTLGLIMSGFPFGVLSIPNGVCMGLGALLISRSKSDNAKMWFFRGLVTMALGLVFQIIIPFEGLFSKDAVFHVFQMAGNYMMWRGVRLY